MAGSDAARHVSDMTMFDSAIFGIGASILILNFATTKKQLNDDGFQRHVACPMCSILEALVVLFNIVKHRLHVCLELVAGQRGGGELCLERF